MPCEPQEDIAQPIGRGKDGSEYVIELRAHNADTKDNQTHRNEQAGAEWFHGKDFSKGSPGLLGAPCKDNGECNAIAHRDDKRLFLEKPKGIDDGPQPDQKEQEEHEEPNRLENPRVKYLLLRIMAVIHLGDLLERSGNDKMEALLV